MRHKWGKRFENDDNNDGRPVMKLNEIKCRDSANFFSFQSDLIFLSFHFVLLAHFCSLFKQASKKEKKTLNLFFWRFIYSGVYKIGRPTGGQEEKDRKFFISKHSEYAHIHATTSWNWNFFHFFYKDFEK